VIGFHVQNATMSTVMPVVLTLYPVSVSG